MKVEKEKKDKKLTKKEIKEMVAKKKKAMRKLMIKS